jgi:N-acetylneuraminic acid mutarotase
VAALDGKIYVAGGFNGQAAFQVYDPATDSWSELADLPTPRAGVAAVALDGMVYVIGGNLGPGWWGDVTGITEVYDPATGTWSSVAPMPTGRDTLAATVLDGFIYAAGGIHVLGEHDWESLNAVESYDPITGTWTVRADMRRGRELFSLHAVAGKVMAIGAPIPYDEVYDPATDTWEKVPPMPTPRHGAAAAMVDGLIYLFGGEGDLRAPSAYAHRYDPSSETWVELADMPFAVDRAAASTVDGKIYVIGGSSKGYPYNPPHSSEVWEFAPQP